MSSKADRLKKLGFVSQSESKDKTYGKIGTIRRDEYERELKIELMGEFLKKIRKSKNITQEELALLMGLKDKSYVSKIENDLSELKLSTLRKYVEALKAVKMSIRIEMEDGHPEELVLI